MESFQSLAGLCRLPNGDPMQFSLTACICVMFLCLKLILVPVTEQKIPVSLKLH